MLRDGRLAMPDAERAHKSLAIAGNLPATVDWSEVASLHCFQPLKALKEVDITPFIDRLQSEFPKIKLFTSRKIDGSWQIVAMDGERAGQQAFDAIIVPMLGFDRRLHRLGYGGGYYDRLLAAQPRAKKIGVCFEQGKVANIPVEPHDIPLDIIATEQKIYRSLY